MNTLCEQIHNSTVSVAVIRQWQMKGCVLQHIFIQDLTGLVLTLLTHKDKYISIPWDCTARNPGMIIMTPSNICSASRSHDFLRSRFIDGSNVSRAFWVSYCLKSSALKCPWPILCFILLMLELKYSSCYLLPQKINNRMCIQWWKTRTSRNTTNKNCSLLISVPAESFSEEFSSVRKKIIDFHSELIDSK